MVTKSINVFLKTISYASVVILTAVILFFVWVYTGPRSLSLISPFVEEELNDISSEFNVRMKDSFIEFDSSRNAINISVRDVVLLNNTNEVIADFPELSFDFSIFRFFRGRILSSDVSILNPKFYINSAYKTLYATPKGDQEAKAHIFKALHEHLKLQNGNFSVSSVRVKNADFYISNGVSDLVWHIKKGYAKLSEVGSYSEVSSEFTIDFGTLETYFNITASPKEDNIFDVRLDFVDLPSYAATDIFPELLEKFKRVDFTVTGGANILFDAEYNVPQIQFEVTGLEGKFDYSDIFGKIFNVNSMMANGNLYNNLSVVALDKFSANVNGVPFSVSGNFSDYKNIPEIMPKLEAELSVSNLDIQNLQYFWPETLSHKVRAWIMDHFSEGKIVSANAKVNLKKDDFEKIIARNELLEKSSGEAYDKIPLPDNAFNISIDIEDATLKYYPIYPEVKKVFANVNVTAQTLEAKITKADILSSKISYGLVKMPNIWQYPLQLEIEADAQGRADDFVQFFNVTKIAKQDNPTIKSITQITGNASGSVSLKFPAKKKLTYNDIDLKISSNFTNTNLPGFINGKDMLNSKFAFTLDKKQIYVSGSGKLDGIEINADYNKNLVDKSEFDQKYRIKSNITANEIKSLGYGNIPYINDRFNLDISLTETGNGRTIEGSADIGTAKVNLDEFGFTKASGAAGKFKFKAIQRKGGTLDVSDFSLEGDDYAASGSATLKEDMSAITAIKLDKIKFGRNDFKVDYKTVTKGKDHSIQLDINGEAVDLSTVEFSKLFKGNGDKKTAKKINADVKTLYMKNDQVITELKADMKCSTAMCEVANIYGKLNKDKFIAVGVKPLSDRTYLLVDSDDAGAFISSLGLSTNIEGGSMNIESTFVKGQTPVSAKGLVKMWEFKAVKTPILGKLLTLASLQGISDILNQQGISFQKFEAPFTINNEIIDVREAKTSGSSVGITAEGQIDMKNGVVDLKGVIIPAQSLNKILGKIPLIGRLIVGGKNEGVIATTYSIKGPYGNVEASVNPLSILTPGFLRNIFDLFTDKSAPVIKGQMQESNAAH